MYNQYNHRKISTHIYFLEPLNINIHLNIYIYNNLEDLIIFLFY